MRLIDRKGDRYGRLVVLERAANSANPKDTNARWLCQCDCGKTSIAYGNDLKRKKVVSCGCWNEEKRTKHGFSRSHMNGLHAGMRQRCHNPNDANYHNYGGRGITVCERWQGPNGLVSFIEDMGDRPKGYTVDRIDNDKGYSPDNCRWATYTAQLNNRRNNRIIEFNGESKTMAEWASALNMNWFTLRQRIDRYGWSIERALTEPVNK